MRILELWQSQGIVYALSFLFSIVVAITFHEFAHAWTADRLGDDTPALQGRVTLNPAAHLDPLGSVLFLLVGFGWGRPVIYNPMRLQRRSDELLVALAGPFSNLLLAIVFNLLTLAVYSMGGSTTPLIVASGVNIALAAFNLIPIPPLDGSSIVAYFWPEYRSLVGGQIGMIILLVVLFLPIGAGGSLLGMVITPIMSFLNLVSHLFGAIPFLGGL